MSIAENIARIKSDLPEGVRLIAVSKTFPPETVLEAYQTGHRDFGENRVQELLPKSEALPKDIRWHLIGHLQTNKVKYVAPFVHLIHSVDTEKLLAEINKQAKKINRGIPVLLQVFIAKEETKFGFSFEEAEAILKSNPALKYPHVRIEGLMGMATNTENTEQVRNEFRSLRLFFDRLNTQYSKLQTLSMGMSGDWKIATEEGSNMIRIGSSIFSRR
jgi:PLP dependent protein